MRVALQQVVTQSIVSNTFGELTFTWGPREAPVPLSGAAPGRTAAFDGALSDLAHLRMHRGRTFAFLEILADLHFRYRQGVPSRVVSEAYEWRSGEYASSKEVGQLLRRCEECFAGIIKRKDLGWSITRLGREALRAVVPATAAGAGGRESSPLESEAEEHPRDG